MFRYVSHNHMFDATPPLQQQYTIIPNTMEHACKGIIPCLSSWLTASCSTICILCLILHSLLCILVLCTIENIRELVHKIMSLRVTYNYTCTVHKQRWDWDTPQDYCLSHPSSGIRMLYTTSITLKSQHHVQFVIGQHIFCTIHIYTSTWRSSSLKGSWLQ